MKLKLLSRITIFLMTKVVRRYGWNNGPRPPGFPPVTYYPFWRFVEGTDGKRIASASLTEAFAASMLEEAGLFAGQTPKKL